MAMLFSRKLAFFGEKMDKLALMPLAAMLLLSSAAVAGITPAPAPDADDYAEGAYLHYDGIRNKGLSAAHDGSSSTWANLGSGGADFDLSRQTGKNPRIGYWDDDGYVFAGYTAKEGFTVWGHDLEVVPDYTLQVVLDAKPNVQTNASGALKLGYVCCPIGYIKGQSSVTDYAGWRYFAMQVRGDTTRLSTPVFKNASQPAVLGASGVAFSYATAMMSGATNAVLFTGVEPPWDAPDGGANGHCLAPSGYEFANQAFIVTNFTLGVGNGLTAGNEGLNEKVRGVRYYKRLLTNAELTWNRMVDEARFFGGPSLAKGVTAVVGTSVAGVEGTEPSGSYIVDSAGYEFTAPAAQTVGGRMYALTGYTLRTWSDETGWGEAEIVESASSYQATAGVKVWLVWNWALQTPAFGIGDYVTDGLVLNYDGICNAGADAPHDPEAATWKNVAPGHEGEFDLEALVRQQSPNDFWLKDGYHFGDNKVDFRYKNSAAPLTIPASFTIQVLVDASSAEQPSEYLFLYTNDVYQVSSEDPDTRADVYSGSSQNFIGYIFFINDKDMWRAGSLSIRRDIKTQPYHPVQFVTDWLNGTTRPVFTTPGDNTYPGYRSKSQGIAYDYITAMVDGGSSMCFCGDARPTANAPMNGAGLCTDATNSTSRQITHFTLGGNVDEHLRGVIKSFRFYSRALSDEELAQNRRVDEARFFGRLATTNAVVSCMPPSLPGTQANGPYAVGTFALL